MKLKPLLVLLLWNLNFSAGFGAGNGPENALMISKFRFYSQDLRLTYDPDWIQLAQIPLKTQDLLTIYGYFERTDYEYSLEQLLHMKKEMDLNDWLYYELLEQASMNIYPEEWKNNRVYFQWFLLRKSGYDAQLYFLGDEVYLHVLTEAQDYGFYSIFIQGKRYINLTAWKSGEVLRKHVAMIPKVPEDGANKAFSLRLFELPELARARKIYKVLDFTHLEEKYSIPVEIDMDQVRMMDNYPYADQRDFFNIELSSSAKKTLLPALRKLLSGKSEREKLEILLSFTRTGFRYKEDQVCYGREKPMTAEQTLYYSFSDCEDRSALFYELVRNLMDVPVIVIDFESHVGVAVAIPLQGGDYFRYKGLDFFYCEPTGPQNELAIGEMWEDIRGQEAKILTEYFPR